jgi:hypothetical protein
MPKITKETRCPYGHFEFCNSECELFSKVVWQEIDKVNGKPTGREDVDYDCSQRFASGFQGRVDQALRGNQAAIESMRNLLQPPLTEIAGALRDLRVQGLKAINSRAERLEAALEQIGGMGRGREGTWPATPRLPGKDTKLIGHDD